MMFSSNQVLEISGCLDHDDELCTALKFALELSGHLESFTRSEQPSECVYQITEDGRYCIGWEFVPRNLKYTEGWNTFPFDFDLNIISQIIAKHLVKQEVKDEYGDGTLRKGFLMKLIPESLAGEKDGIVNPFHGIVSFEPYTCFYSK